MTAVLSLVPMSPVAGTATPAPVDAALRTRESLFDAIRLSRRLGQIDPPARGAVAAFPTAIVHAGRTWDLELSSSPGFFGPGEHEVTYRLEAGGLVVDGSFSVLVVDSPADPRPATWSLVRAPRGIDAVPAAVAEQLPASIVAVCHEQAGLRRALRRVHLAASEANQMLLDSNRGLVRSVVNRYRGVVRGEAASLELSDLMIVGEHQLLDVVDRYFTDPEQPAPREVAWSKLVQRAVGNAVRSEIARATGISVEFRQLLSWFHSHPEDRNAEPALVAHRMAFAAGVTRLMAQHAMHSRAAGIALLDEMLRDGRARYVAPDRDASRQRRELRDAGVFVISPRSSISEIERAQQFAGTPSLTIDEDRSDGGSSAHETLLVHAEGGFEETEHADCLRRTISDAGMSPVEALVWLHRSGALDPGGHGDELPEIADELGLSGRSEARAALRRARRKLDHWSVGGGRVALAAG